MTTEQMTVNGPEIVKPSHSVETADVGNNTPFELPDGRWGIKLNFGAIVFYDRGDCITSTAYTLKELESRDDLLRCRVLPGKVEITYRTPESVVPKVSVKEISAIMREEIDRQNQRSPDYA